MIDGKLYCLPYFFLAGMPKCGTTDIWSKISQHPQVAAAQKEPHWWTRGMIKGKHGIFVNNKYGWSHSWFKRNVAAIGGSLK